MRNRAFIRLAAIAFVISASGCSVANYRTDDSVSLVTSNVAASDVEVYSTDEIGKKYLVLGSVVASADAGTNAKISVDMLKEEAAKLGANAIINLRLAIDAGYMQNAIKSTGTAVIIEE